MIKLAPPAFNELNDYYKSYWKYLNGDDLNILLEARENATSKWFSKIPSSVEDFAYAEGKWTLKEVVGHLCDTERILAYRALTCSRNDKSEMPGFDENSYVPNSNFSNRTLNDIAAEWKTVRSATISLFSSMTDEMADRKGIANGNAVSARSILYFILMHEIHHLEIIKERYLSSALGSK